MATIYGKARLDKLTRNVTRLGTPIDETLFFGENGQDLKRRIGFLAEKGYVFNFNSSVYDE